MYPSVGRGRIYEKVGVRLNECVPYCSSKWRLGGSKVRGSDAKMGEGSRPSIGSPLRGGEGDEGGREGRGSKTGSRETTQSRGSNTCILSRTYPAHTYSIYMCITAFTLYIV